MSSRYRDCWDCRGTVPSGSRWGLRRTQSLCRVARPEAASSTSSSMAGELASTGIEVSFSGTPSTDNEYPQILQRADWIRGSDGDHVCRRRVGGDKTAEL